MDASSGLTHSTEAHRANLRDRLRLRHLRLLDQIAQTGSVTAAAQALRLAQPAATHMLQEIEAAFGVALVVRGPTGSQLSPAGHAVLQRLRLALHALDLASAMAAAPSVRPIIRLGLIPTLAVEILPALLAHLRAHPDQPRVVVRENSAPYLMTALQDGSLDAIFSRLESGQQPWPAAPTLAVQALPEGHLIVACAATHPLAQAQLPLDHAALQAAGWILPPTGTGLRQVFERYFTDAGLVPPVATVESASPHTNLALASASDLLTLAPQAAARVLLHSGALAAPRLAHALPRLRTVFAYRADTPFPLLATIQGFLQQYARP